jgi:hypothetical protein
MNTCESHANGCERASALNCCMPPDSAALADTSNAPIPSTAPDLFVTATAVVDVRAAK